MLSVIPAITAKKLGMVAECKTNIANHSKVSEDNLEKYSAILLRIFSTLNPFNFFTTIEDMSSNLGYPF